MKIKFKVLVNILLYQMISDISEYKEGKSSNGGCYSFSFRLRYDRLQMRYYWEHFTSADFDYCRYCGSFHYSECKPIYLTYEELKRDVENLIVSLLKDSFYVDDNQSELYSLIKIIKNNS